MNLLDKVKSSGYSVLRISKETGIPHSRIYKWYEGKGEPKLADSEVLMKWLEKVKSKQEESENLSNSNPVEQIGKTIPEEATNSLANSENSQRNQLIHDMLNSERFSDKEKLMFMLKLYRLLEGEYDVLEKMYKSLSGKKDFHKGQEQTA